MVLFIHNFAKFLNFYPVLLNSRRVYSPVAKTNCKNAIKL